MARIRSIHPGMASDEAFMSMSFPAQAGWPLLWTECDDHGMFEWKPLVLKARIFPATSIDFATLLAEWEGLGCIKKVEIDGKPYGLVRNFCKFQRPKKPSYRFALPKEHELFVGVSVTTPEPVPNQLPTSVENPTLMEEEGGRRKEEKKKTDSRAVARATRPNAGKIFDDEFWPKYPKRDGENPKAPARKAFIAAVKNGHDPAVIVAGVPQYAARMKASGQIGSKYVAQAVTWLNQARWEDYGPEPPMPAASALTGFYAADGTPELDAWDAYWRATKGTNAMRDKNFGWTFPTRWPPGHDQHDKAA